MNKEKIVEELKELVIEGSMTITLARAAEWFEKKLAEEVKSAEGRRMSAKQIREEMARQDAELFSNSPLTVYDLAREIYIQLVGIWPEKGEQLIERSYALAKAFLNRGKWQEHSQMIPTQAKEDWLNQRMNRQLENIVPLAGISPETKKRVLEEFIKRAPPATNISGQSITNAVHMTFTELYGQEAKSGR